MTVVTSNTVAGRRVVRTLGRFAATQSALDTLARTLWPSSAELSAAKCLSTPS